VVAKKNALSGVVRRCPFIRPVFPTLLLGRDGKKSENFLDMLRTVSVRQRMAAA
jgi:hypothetical protein